MRISKDMSYSLLSNLENTIPFIGNMLHPYSSRPIVAKRIGRLDQLLHEEGFQLYEAVLERCYGVSLSGFSGHIAFESLRTEDFDALEARLTNILSREEGVELFIRNLEKMYSDNSIGPHAYETITPSIWFYYIIPPFVTYRQDFVRIRIQPGRGKDTITTD